MEDCRFHGSLCSNGCGSVQLLYYCVECKSIFIKGYSQLSNVGALKIEIGVKKVFMWMNIIYSWYVVIKQLDLKELPFTLPRLMYSQLMCVLCGHGVGGHHLEFFGHCKMVAICGERSLKDKIQSLNTLGSLTAPT